MRVVVLRHGNTFDPGEVIRRVGRGTDLPLSSSGQAQAKALSAHFDGWTFDRVISSPLRRTRQTAEAIAAGTVRFDDRLLEIDYGPDEGKPEAEVVARIGEAALRRWDEDAVPPRAWRVDPDTVRADWADLLGEVESMAGAEADVGAKPHDTTLIVTSNGIARFVLDLAQHDGAARKLKTGAYGILARRPDGWHVTAWNVRPDRD